MARGKITLSELADILGINLEIVRYPNQNNRFSCSFERSEAKKNKDDIFLTGTYGNGRSPQAAMRDYVRNIRGLLLIINAYSPNRKEFQVPTDLIFG